MPRVPGFFAPLATTMPDGVDRLRNLFREETGDPERPYRFVRRPGRRAYATGLHGPVRGGVELDGRCDFIAGERWYDLASDGTVTEIGEVAPDTRPAMMITNGTAGDQTVAVSGGKLYLRDRSNGTFGQVTDTDLPGDILGIVHTDLYGVAWFKDSRAFRISNIDDLSAWEGGDVAERSQYVDNIQAIVADQKELLILGTQTNDSYWNSGDADFPFEPVPNALSRQGSASIHSARLLGDTPYWCGKSADGLGPVFRMNGYTPQKISTHYIDRKIQALAVVSDAYAYVFEEGGHRFYVLTFPSADVSLAFDEAVDPSVAWSEWTYQDPYTARTEADLARCHFFAFGKHLVGSRKDGTLYEQSLDLHDDDGAEIICDRVFRGPRNAGKRVFLSEVRLDAQVGVGTDEDQDDPPLVMLRKSRDGGRSWGPENTRSLGEVGEYGQRVRWQRAGVADDPAWWLRVTDPRVLSLNDFYVEAEGGAH